MPDINALDSALYVSLQNSGVAVTGPSFPYSVFVKPKNGYNRSIETYQDSPYSHLQYSDFSIDKREQSYDIPVYSLPVNNTAFDYVEFEVDEGKLYTEKDTVLGIYAFNNEQEFEEIYTNISDTSEYTEAYFDDMYYFFVDGLHPDMEDIDKEDLTIIQEFIKLKPKVYSPPRVLTDLIAQMEVVDMDVLSYDYMSSPILYTGITPFVQVGTRLNKVIYPKTTMRTRGLATRRVCL